MYFVRISQVLCLNRKATITAYDLTSSSVITDRLICEVIHTIITGENMVAVVTMGTEVLPLFF
jgi:hypothetical protein